jgi:hypothetical protein
MSRTIRMFGPLLLMGKQGIENAASFGSTMEASPIYQTAAITLRIWGTRTSNAFGPAVTETIDQTETVTYTRGFAPIGITGVPQALFEHRPGGPEQQGPAPTDIGLATKYGVSATIAMEEVGGIFSVNQNEHLWNPFNFSHLPSGPFGFQGRINPKRQRIIGGGAPDQGPSLPFTFSRTTTPPGTTADIDRDYSLSWPQWATANSIPAYGRGELELWGYGGLSTELASTGPAYIDTSAWSATQWRDYRDTWIFPDLDMTAGWDSGDMKARYTVVLS